MTKIMALGDSITQGQNTGYGSYRRLLYDLLTADGISVDFVGSLSDGAFPDPDHEGHTGEEIISIWARIETSGILLTYTPDIVLLIIGTNDIWHGADPSPSAALTMLNNLLTSIPSFSQPNTKVLVGSIPPIATFVAGSTVSANVNTYNAGIPALVAARGANFSFVDINAGLTTSDLADGVHPTDAGNDKIANIWAPAILAALDVVYLVNDANTSDFLTQEGTGNQLVALSGDGGGAPINILSVAYGAFSLSGIAAILTSTVAGIAGVNVHFRRMKV